MTFLKVFVFISIGVAVAYVFSLLRNILRSFQGLEEAIAANERKAYREAAQRIGVAELSKDAVIQNASDLLQTSSSFECERRIHENDMQDLSCLAPLLRSFIEMYDEVKHIESGRRFGALYVTRKVNAVRMYEIGESDSGALCVFPDLEVIFIDTSLRSERPVIVPVADSIYHWILILDAFDQETTRSNE